MSEQKNNVADPAAILADYDFSKSDGSAKDTGEVTTEGWPSDVDKSKFNNSGLDIVPKWINSHYSKPTQENIKQFAKTIDDYVEATVRINVLKASQNKLRKQHLKSSERVCIAILSYEDTDNLGELENKYPISRESLRRAQYAFDNIIDVQGESITKSKLDNEIERYMGSHSRSVAEGMQDVGNKETKDNENAESDETNIVIKLELNKTTAKAVVLDNELPDGVMNKLRHSILEGVGL